MATEYTVALKNLVSGPAAEATRAADRLRTSLTRLEAQPVTVGGRSGTNLRRIADDWQKLAAQAERASSREAAARIRAAQQAARVERQERIAGSRAFQAAEDAKRNAAFRRLQAQQREEERFTRYRIQLMRREQREAEQNERRLAAARARIAEQPLRARRQTRSNALSVLGGGVAGALTAGAAAGTAALAYGGKTVLDTAKEIESAKLRLTALLGSEKLAGEEIHDLLRAAAKTKFDFQDLIEASSSLSASFADSSERRYVLASLTDLVTVAGGDKEDLGRVVLALNQVIGKGKLEAEELNQIIEPLKGVVSRKDFYLEVGRLIGVSGKDEQETIDKLQKLQKAGKIGATTAVQAVTNVGRRKAGGGTALPAGAVAVREGESISGILSNIRTGLATLIADANVTEWPGVVALKNALREVAAFFEVDNASGKKFASTLRTMSALVAPIVTLSKGLFGLVVQLGDSPVLLELLSRGLRQVAVGLITVGAVIGGVIGGALALAGAMEKVLEVSARWAIAGYKAASDFVSGIIEGLKAGLGRIVESVETVGATIVGGFKRVLKISSPSRVAMALGGEVPEGFALGIEAGTSRVRGAALALPEAAASGISRTVAIPQGAGSGSGAGSYSISLSISLPVMSATDPSELAREGGALLGSRIQLELDRYFGRKLAQGVA